MARSQYLPLHRVSNDRRGGPRGRPGNGRMMDGTAGASPFRAPVVALDGPDKVTGAARYTFDVCVPGMLHAKIDRKSTRLNSSHLGISYAVFCLKKKKQTDSFRI